MNLDKIMSSKKAAAINWQERGGPGRDHDVLMEFQFNKVGVQIHVPSSAIIGIKSNF
jgi:hypothetical protein